MEDLKFEWDYKKNEINKQKHDVSFEEAVTVFQDEDALLISDPDHSQDEDRFIIMGYSNQANMLVVCHCYRDDDKLIRIISARKATKRESGWYFKNG